jgi:exoribonuclease R
MSPLVGILRTKNYTQFQLVDHADTVYDLECLTVDKALPGDTIAYDPETKVCRLQKRAKHYPIVGTIELTSKTKYGFTSRGTPMYLFIPYLQCYPPMVVGCSERDVSVNRIGLAEFDSWTANLPRAVLRSVLGPCGNRDVERDAIRLAYSPYPDTKDKSLEEQNESWLDRPSLPETTFNIDPEGCVDIDDVLSIDTDKDGRRRLWISIADVSEILHQNHSIVAVAALRGQTIYDNGVAVSPMLPRWLSEDLCSLHANCWRPTVTLRVTEIGDTSFTSEWLLTKCWNKQSYIYDTFCDRAHEQEIPLDLLKSFCWFVIGESESDPHTWIEACMLHYNIQAATLLNENGKGIFRKHRGKKVELLSLVEKLYEQNADILQPQELEGLANSAAEYCSAQDPDKRHVGLGEVVYCHASSPIRRYADFVNQTYLKQCLGRSDIENPYWGSISWLNQRQKAAKACERELFLLDQLTLNQKGTVEALVFDCHPVDSSAGVLYKVKLWIPHWKRMITWKTLNPLPDTAYVGCRLMLSYFCNPAQRRWKDKLVFRLENVLTC